MVIALNNRMQAHKYNKDPALAQYVEILSKQQKFKAKVLYTLTCINNCLASSGALYLSNLEYLSHHAKVFLSIAQAYPDPSVLQPLCGLFFKFEEIGITGIASQLLDIVEQGKMQGDISDSLLSNICGMLNMVRHKYSKTKSICIKLIQKCGKKLSTGRV